ncbi:hypothetical protein LWI28_002896 [Acer negundo]|uniref:Btz domain-containing protein n=1 Tax=Acer negundo TaxID=4023 RepID=A0AAD5ICL6_ACENE|nr:hypothetical protein LWI28_002896 [Acer negundo]KAK4844883.1 hypothetical protein QYF36_025622 [Acer negundo]
MATTTAVDEAETVEVVEEYDSDPEEVKRSLVMRRREASDDEEEESEERARRKGGGKGRMEHRVLTHSDDESDGEGGAPADYDDEEEHDEELEEEVYEDEEDDGVYEEEEAKEEEGNDPEVKIKRMESVDGEKTVEGDVDATVDDNDNEKNDVAEETEEGKKESSEPFAVPTAGAFYMHDDRFRDNVGGRHRRTQGGRKLWESKDDRKWGHDKFEEMTVQERHYEEGSRTSRGRYRTRSKNRGPDHGYPRGNRSKAFNNSNNNQNQAPKGVRGRGPRRYEPAYKNSNQAPLQNKQSMKPLEKSTYTNSGRSFTSTSNLEFAPAPARKQVFASSLSSASPPFYPSGSSNKDITLTQKRDVQSGSTSRNLRTSGVDEGFSVQQTNAMVRGKNIADMDKLYIDDSNASVGKPLNNLQMPLSSQSKAHGRGVAIPQKIGYQPIPPHNQANKVSLPTQFHAVQRSPGQSRVQPSVQSPSQQLGQRSASGSQASSPPNAASVINSYDSGEMESPSESNKSKTALVGKVKGNGQGRGSFPYGGAQVVGATGNMSVGHGDQNFPTFLPVMQFGGQHPGGIGVPAVGMAFPGYVSQPQLGLGNSEMTWLPVLTGAAGALGAAYCSPYLAVDGSYHPRPVGQTSATASSSKENSTNKPNNEWKPSQRPEPGTDELVQQQQNKPQPRRYSAMNLANDVLR